MSNPWLQLQDEVAVRLAAVELLAPIPVITETLGNITNRIDMALAKGGTKVGATGKGGLAILVFTPKGGTRMGASNSRTLSPQTTTVRIVTFVRPLINDGASGQQKAPLDVHHAIMVSMLGWNRGLGQPAINITTWDSRETPGGEISYFADYEVPQFIALT